ncbi:hypothetical protein DMH15_08675 [Streptomyces sp. WAC 06725]|uniref:LppU/SCO3897 family protein n=1 Tax=Streptomyces sp. WAC 06725 TaxID=2203209 RepID=UPI000F744345|nr:hypothetical protein [Streptomyces sp. WAC 06725]RSO45397.1 hypothetical protein DMH15_08675 [Streptomyces sp. WAC 06725]
MTMPPPPGQNPYGQNPYGQNPYPQAPNAPYGQPPQGSVPYGQPPQAPNAPYGQPQGGYAPPPQMPQQQGAPWPQAAPPQQPYGMPPQGGAPQPPGPQRSDSVGRKVFRVVLSLVVLGLVLGGLAGFNSLFGTDAKKAAVGDCMKNNGTTIRPDMEKVDCTASDAAYKVAEVHDDTTDEKLCDLTKYNAYSEATGRRHRNKVVLCLEDIKK